MIGRRRYQPERIRMSAVRMSTMLIFWKARKDFRGK